MRLWFAGRRRIGAAATHVLDRRRVENMFFAIDEDVITAKAQGGASRIFFTFPPWPASDRRMNLV
jgi:hypothetical protein